MKMGPTDNGFNVPVMYCPLQYNFTPDYICAICPAHKYLAWQLTAGFYNCITLYCTVTKLQLRS